MAKQKEDEDRKRAEEERLRRQAKEKQEQEEAQRKLEQESARAPSPSPSPSPTPPAQPSAAPTYQVSPAGAGETRVDTGGRPVVSSQNAEEVEAAENGEQLYEGDGRPAEPQGVSLSPESPAAAGETGTRLHTHLGSSFSSVGLCDL